MQELIEAEAAEFIGATCYERSESRTNERNDSRPRMLATKAGDFDLRIPKLRKGFVLPASPPAAVVRSSGSTWATARTRCSGAASSPR
jgi:hypothetical protein